jgi:zinc transport system ATP-binding protein
MADPTHIQIEKLNFSYGNIAVLEDVSFQISKGEFVAIIGPNGGGKTTLLKLLLGFLQPLNGTVRIKGSKPKAVRQSLAYVPQALDSDRQFPISVREVVLSGCLSKANWFGRYRKEDIEHADKIIEELGLKGLVRSLALLKFYFSMSLQPESISMQKRKFTKFSPT